jgi:hypothetical protein
MPREFAQDWSAVQIGAFEIRRTLGKAFRAVKVFVELQLVSPPCPEKWRNRQIFHNRRRRRFGRLPIAKFVESFGAYPPHCC